MTVKLLLLKSGEDVVADVSEMVVGEEENRRVVGYFLSKPCIVKMQQPEVLSEQRNETKSGYRVFSVEYRLAPEFKFPVPVEDCFSALDFINKNHEDLLVDKDKIVVAGDSAGANLATVVAIMARDKKDINLAYQLLIYPTTDASSHYPSYEENSKSIRHYFTARFCLISH